MTCWYWVTRWMETRRARAWVKMPASFDRLLRKWN